MFITPSVVQRQVFFSLVESNICNILDYEESARSEVVVSLSFLNMIEMFKCIYEM
jgi:hypothetical protein